MSILALFPDKIPNFKNIFTADLHPRFFLLFPPQITLFCFFFQIFFVPHIIILWYNYQKINPLARLLSIFYHI